MVSVGVLYLLFETSMLASSANGGRQQKGCSRLSRSLLGFQIGLIVLAMIVTSSSIRSLQAKQGLPVGNQVVGWLVLGKPHSTVISILKRTTSDSKYSRLTFDTFLVLIQHRHRLSSPPDNNLPHILPCFRHPYHLLRGTLLLLLFRYTYHLGSPGTPYLYLHSGESHKPKFPVANTEASKDRCFGYIAPTVFLTHQWIDALPRPVELTSSISNLTSSISPAHISRSPSFPLLSLPYSIRLFLHRQHRLSILLQPRLRLPPDSHFQSLLARRLTDS